MLPDAPDDSDHPYPRTPTEQALMTSATAWAWHSRGYETGYTHGLMAGYEAVIADLKQAYSALDVRDLIHSVDAHARRNRTHAPDEDLDERRRRCAESWGLPVDGAA